MSVAEPTAVVDALKRIEARISDPERWCQRTSARDANGSAIGANHPNAARWCIDGGVLTETHGMSYEIYSGVYDTLSLAARGLYPSETGCVGINDHLGHDAVMAVIRKAIELADGGAS